MSSHTSPGSSRMPIEDCPVATPPVSILIVSWNVRELVRECLASLEAGGVFDWAQVIVVDNHSADDTVRMVRCEFPRVQLIASETNLGFSRGSNLAYRQSNGKYILLLNPDTVVSASAVLKLVAFLEHHREYGAVGPKQTGRNGNTQFEAAVALPTIWNVLCDWLALSRVFPRSQLFAGRKLGSWDHESSREVPALAGSAMLVRRCALEQIGLLDETMFMIEDMDLCFRLRQAGHKIYYLASAAITHLGGESLRKKNNPGLQLQIAFHSFWIYLRKNKGSHHALLLSVVMFCWSLGATVVAAVFWLFTALTKQGHLGHKWWRYATALLSWTMANKNEFSHPLAAPIRSARSLAK